MLNFNDNCKPEDYLDFDFSAEKRNNNKAAGSLKHLLNVDAGC